jgi:hypothetical protein
MAKRKIGSWTFGNAVATVYRDSEYQDYQVKLKVNGCAANPDTAYFTDDRNDAMQTAQHMARQANTEKKSV